MVANVSERILHCSDTDDVDREMQRLTARLNHKGVQMLGALIVIALEKEKDIECKSKLKRAVEYLECEELMLDNH